MPIPNKRKLEWVSDDIEDARTVTERTQRARQAIEIKRVWSARKHEAESRADYYNHLLGRGLSANQANLVAYGDMPAIKKGRKKPAGIGATYRAKQKAANYGATPSFNRALVAAVKKVENRSQETVYSQSGAYLDSSLSTLTKTGYTLSGLNQSAAFTQGTAYTRVQITNACFVWPLSPMAQVGNSSTPGYRKGQSINPVGFRYYIYHQQSLNSVPATYKFALLRNKGVTLTTGNTTPGIASTDSLGLFVPLIQGPLATSGGPNGSLPLGDVSSSMRWNRAEWQVCKSGSWNMTSSMARENSALITSPTVAGGISTAFKQVTGYIPIKDATWLYPLPTTISGIKGGDYYFVVWREGPADNAISADKMSMTFELSFKDP